VRELDHTLPRKGYKIACAQLNADKVRQEIDAVICKTAIVA
jgi:hypothetical protein